MGILADTALEHHGKVIGIMPSVFGRQRNHAPRHHRKNYCKDMHERKMTSNNDIFAMPGVAERWKKYSVITWNQISVHQNPIVFNDNLCGYDQ